MNILFKIKFLNYKEDITDYDEFEKIQNNPDEIRALEKKYELEPGTLRLPVLIKKYIKQNARLVAFNVDPLFNNAIDGLIYLRISDIPESTMKPVIEEYQAELERKSNEKED